MFLTSSWRSRLAAQLKHSVQPPTMLETFIITLFTVFFFIKEPPTRQFTPKIELATLYTFDLG
jgi:hypothetical protein